MILSMDQSFRKNELTQYWWNNLDIKWRDLFWLNVKLVPYLLKDSKISIDHSLTLKQNYRLITGRPYKLDKDAPLRETLRALWSLPCLFLHRSNM